MFDVEKRIAQGLENFNATVGYVLGEGQSQDAYSVEVRVFREVLAMGLHLLAAYFEQKAGGDVGQAIETNGPFELRGEAEIVSRLDELLAAFVAQGRMRLAADSYEPCYRLVA